VTIDSSTCSGVAVDMLARFTIFLLSSKEAGRERELLPASVTQHRELIGRQEEASRVKRHL
jgi:hypothetical protein